MDVRVVGVSYKVDNRPRSLLGYLLAQTRLNNSSIFQLSDADAVVLQDINLRIKQGGVTVFTGLGLGHKCLIECIALRQREGLMSGKILYDGTVRKNGYFKDMVLVLDLGVSHFNTLTVFDYLYFGARLRISHGVIECRERARQAARLVGLDGMRQIGSLSRAELRILDIAAELVSNPTLICLIDPTEGLDASSKVDVMKVLRAIAGRVDSPTTIIYNVSSLDSDTLPLVDEVAIFSGKHLEYVNSVQRFRELGLEDMARLVCQLSLVILDDLKCNPITKATVSPQHYLTLMKVVEKMLDLEAVRSGTTPQSPISKMAMADHLRLRKTQFFSASRRIGESGSKVRYRKSLLKEFSILATRSLKYHYHNALYLRMSLYRFTALCLFIGGLTYNDGETMKDAYNLTTGSYGQSDRFAYNVTSVCYILVALSLVGVAFTVPHLHANAKLLKFEVSSGLQSPIASWLSLLLVDVPIYILIAIIVSMIVFYMVNISGSASNYLGTTFMVLFISYSLALNCAIWCSSMFVSTILYAALSLFFLLFSGYLQPIDNLPALWYWATQMAYTRWAFEGYMVTSFDEAVDGDNYLDLYNFRDDSVRSCNSYQLVWFFGLQALVVVGLVPPWSKLRLSAAPPAAAEGDPTAHPARKTEYTAHDDYVSMDSNGHLPVDIVRIASRTGAGAEGGDASLPDGTQSAVDMERGSFFPSASRPHPLAGAAVVSQLHMDRPDVETVLERSPDSFSLAIHDDQPKIVFAPKSMTTTLSFQRIKYFQDLRTVENDEGLSQAYSEQVLDGITGIVHPGKCCCIVDGCGDRSSLILLQILAGMGQATGKITGIVCANQQRLGGKQTYFNAAYVQRGDMPYLSALTVREALRYAALLRRTDQSSTACLGTSWNPFSSTAASAHTSHAGKTSGGGKGTTAEAAEHSRVGRSSDLEERVQEVLVMLGLESVADQRIGPICDQSDEERSAARLEQGDKSLSVARHLTSARTKLWQHLHPPPASITAAQLRLTTIGMELVNRPGLVFLEDPFWGLEWQDAEHVAVVLRCLAEGNRTILCNIDKPVRNVVQHFHELFLLGSGLLLYSGPTELAAEYFANIGFHREEGQSELDYLLDIAADRGKMGMTGGKRGAALTPVDLADLNRSLVSIKTGPSLEADGRWTEESDHESDPELRSNLSNTSNQSSSSVLSFFRPKRVVADYYYAMDDGSMTDSQPGLESSRGKASSSTSLSGASASGQTSEPSGVQGARFKRREQPVAVTSTPRTSPLGPTASVLLRRGLQLLFSDRKAVAWYLVKCLLAGLVMGSVWWKVNRGDVQARLSLFAAMYISMNLQIVNAMDGIYRRKEIFVRESIVSASNYLSHFAMDAVPTLLLFAMGAFLTVSLTSLMAGLRAGGGPFFYLFLLLLAAMYCNTALAYALSMQAPSAVVGKMLYTGLLLPLQLLMSGYLVLIPTMRDWSAWGAYICPMSYFLASALRNECSGNSYALPEGMTYNDVEDQYGYHADRSTGVGILLAMAVVYQLVWLCLLRLHDLTQQRSVRRKVLGVRRQARLILQASLRWSESMRSTNSTMRFEEDALAELEIN